MPTIDWPANLRPQQFSPALRKAGLQFRSPFNGTAQAIDFVAERWVFSLTLPPRRVADGNPGQVEALINRLAGGVERVRCHHWYRPAPMGTLRGSPTLSSSAARGNTSLAITGAVATPNLIRHSEFEIDSNADGVADGWQLLSGGTTGTLTPSLGAGGSSGLAQRLNAAGLGSSSGDLAGVRTAALVAGVQPGAAYTLAANLGGTIGCELALSIDWYTSANAFISSSTTAAAAGASLERRSLSATAPGAAAKADLLLYMRARTGGPALTTFLADAVQFEASAAATAYAGFATLLAGDMLGAGGQLFQVAEDVTLNDAGAGTVSVVNRVRAAISSSAAVTWDRPTTEFIMPANFGAASYRPAILEGMPVDLEEIW